MRNMLKLMTGVAVAVLLPSGTFAQAPKSGGTLANQDLADVWLDQ